MPTSYRYDRTTGAYAGTGTYTLNHLGEIIIGSHETATEPPTLGDNKCARYLDIDGNVPSNHGVNGAKWEIVADYIGTTYYNKDGITVSISQYGDVPPAGTLLTAPPNKYYKIHNGSNWIYENADHVEDRVNEIKALLAEKYNSRNFSYTYDSVEYNWQVDYDSQKKIAAGATKATFTEISPTQFPWEGDDTYWRTAENVDVTFATALDFMIFANAVFDYCKNLWQIAKDHKTAIRLLTDETDIDNYDITVNW